MKTARFDTELTAPQWRLRAPLRPPAVDAIRYQLRALGRESEGQHDFADGL